MTTWKKNIILFASFLFFINAFSQREADHWVQAGLHIRFNGNTAPVIDSLPLLSSLGSNAGSATVSDKNGRMLFYTDGVFVYNRLYQKMPGCGISGLLGPVSVSNELCSQPALVIPYPGNDSLYILFHIYYGFPNNFTPVLNYSLININAQNGLGDVVLRNQPLLGGQQVQLKLTSVLHCNKKHIWVLGHIRNSDRYFSMLVTESGIDPNPVFSPVTPIIEPTGTIVNDYYKGCVKVSPLGDKLAAAYEALDSVEYCDFNSQTGIVSNPKWLYARPVSGVRDVVGNGPFGVEFSPSGNRLYVSATYKIHENATGLDKNTAFIYQFNTALPSMTAIQNSRYMLDSNWNADALAIQMANNGRMYVNGFYGALYGIHNPEGLNGACNLVRTDVIANYPENRFSGINLPNFLQSYFRYPVIAVNGCVSQSINFSLQNTTGIASVNWNFDDPASGINNTSGLFTPVHAFSQAGAYRVRVVIVPANGCANDTLYKIVHAGILSASLGNDTAFCSGDTLQLRLARPVSYATYEWSTGSADSTIRVTQSGQYWVKIFAGDCVVTDTINVTVRSLPQFTLGNDTAICGNQPYTLQPQPAITGATYLWNTNAGTSSINAVLPGLYWLQLTDQYGCRSRDSINISFKTLPSFNLGNDTALCQGQSRILRANVTANNYLWSTGESTPQIVATTTGWYWCDATLNGCTYRDSIRIQFKPIPVVQLGADTTMCEDQIYIINASNPSASYQWQDGSVSSSFTVTQPGTYYVKVTMNGCSVADTINIRYNQKPRVNLGPDLAYCAGMQLMINPETQYAQSFLWQDGSSSRVYTAAQEGLYHLTVSNHCGSRSDTVQITKGVCKVYVPGAFTPNNDGVNDLFKIQYGEGITGFEINIYNRWGQRVFFSTDKNKGWDGRMGNKILSGAYSWTIKFKESANNTNMLMKGIVLLIR